MGIVLIYEALYVFEATTLHELSISPGDLIEVDERDIPHGVDSVHPEVWLKAFNRATGVDGKVPGNFLRFSKSVSRHTLKQTYFEQPVMCILCQDYAWGQDSLGMKCEACNACYHNGCAEFANNNDCKLAEHNNNVPNGDMRPRSVMDWSTSNVVEWMATVNLYRYVECFKKKAISGADLFELDDAQLEHMGIKNEFHRKALMVCIDELCGRTQENVSSLDAEECTSDSAEHKLKEHSFSTLQRCHKCNKYLYGIIRQGFQCSVCGLCLHRQCKVGKIPACGSDRLATRRRSSFVSEPLFGVELDCSVPDILSLCIGEIERQRQDKDEKTVNVYTVYRAPTSSETVISCKKMFDETSHPSVRNIDVNILGGVVKKYLRELFNPLIPGEYYDRFIEAAKIEDPVRRQELVSSLVNELPEHHNTTLKFLMAHFCVMCRTDVEKRKLAEVFGHILLRPDWHEIIKIVHNAEYNGRIFACLYNLQNQEMPEPAPVPLPRPAVTSPGLERLNDDNEINMRLEDCGWFWGDISREDVHDKLNGTPDGTFLVRFAANHATHGDYTLTLRKGGVNKLIKIYRNNGKFGFSHPFEFESVQHLVHHFKSNSLETYNPQLKTRLLHPVSRTPDTQVLGDPNSIMNELLTTHEEFLEKSGKYDDLLETQSKTTQDIQMLYQALDSFKELVKVFEDQMRLHHDHQSRAREYEHQQLAENFDLLDSRLRSIKESKDKLDYSIKAKATENRNMIAEINSRKPEIKALDKKRENLIKRLLSTGVFTKAEIDVRLESLESKSSVVSNSVFAEQRHFVSNQPDMLQSLDLPHRDQDTWFLPEATRDTAQTLLQNKREETFLIRRGRESPYVLSVVANGSIGHCKIFQGPQGYGFADPYMIHETLMDLVIHYHDTSLSEHNDSLNVLLLYPVNAQ